MSDTKQKPTVDVFLKNEQWVFQSPCLLAKDCSLCDFLPKFLTCEKQSSPNISWGFSPKYHISSDREGHSLCSNSLILVLSTTDSSGSLTIWLDLLVAAVRLNVMI